MMHDDISATLYQLLKPQEERGFRINGPIKGHCGKVYKITDTEGNTFADIVEVYPQGAKPHYHKKGTELYNMIKGEGTLYVDNQPIEIEVGQPAVVIKPKRVHRIIPSRPDEEAILQVVSIPRSYPNDSFAPDGRLL